jgi:hypothetical protein
MDFFSNREESTFLNTLSTAVAAHNHHTHTHTMETICQEIIGTCCKKQKLHPLCHLSLSKQNVMMEEPLKLCQQSKLHHTLALPAPLSLPALPFSKYKLFAVFSFEQHDKSFTSSC